MKVLFTTPFCLAYPAVGGPHLRMENSIKALSKVCELHVVSRVPKYLVGEDAGENHFKKYCKSFDYAPSVDGISGNRYFRKLQKIFRALWSDEDNIDAEFLLDYVDKNGIDVIWFGYGNLSYPLIKIVKQIRPGLKAVCDTDGVWSRLVLRELPFESNLNRRIKIEKEGKEKEREEMEGVNIADITTTVSEIDADYYREAAIDPARVMIFSNGIDVMNYEVCPPPPQNFKQPCIIMAGSFYNSLSPMVRSAHWVLEEILPLIKMEIPDIHVYLVGRGSKENLGWVQRGDATVTGTLPSVLPYLCNADVAIVPLQFESGTRFKILEAGAARVPIVSTTLGAEGLPIADGEGIVLADDAHAFAAAVVKIIKDPEFSAKLSMNCYSFIDEKCSLKSLEREAINVLERLSC